MGRAKKNSQTSLPVQGDEKKVRTLSPEARQSSEKVETGVPKGLDLKGWWSTSMQFLREVRVEFDKTAWPTRKETIGLTTAVLALTFFFTAFLGLVDITLSKLVGWLVY